MPEGLRFQDRVFFSSGMSCNEYIGVILFCMFLPHTRITAVRSIYQVLSMFLTVLCIKHTNFLGKIQYKNKERDTYKPAAGKERFHHSIIQCTIIVYSIYNFHCLTAVLNQVLV